MNEVFKMFYPALLAVIFVSVVMYVSFNSRVIGFHEGCDSAGLKVYVEMGERVCANYTDRIKLLDKMKEDNARTRAVDLQKLIETLKEVNSNET